MTAPAARCLFVLALLGRAAVAQDPPPKPKAEAERPRLVVQLGHVSGVASAQFSRDGKYVVTGGREGTARLWERDTGKELRQFRGHTGGVTGVAFSTDGKRILTGSSDSTARLWDATGQELMKFKSNGSVTSAVFSPDGKQVLTWSVDAVARLWDATTGDEVRQFKTRGLGPGATVAAFTQSATFSADGKHVLTGGMLGDAACLWDAATRKEVTKFKGHESVIASAAVSPDGTQVLTGSWDGTARLWDAATGKQLQLFKGHKGKLTSVAFFPDAKSVVTGSEDETIRIWEAATGEPVRTFKAHADEVLSVAVSVDGKRLLSGGDDEFAREWDAATGKEVKRFGGSAATVYAAVFSPDGKRILTASEDRARLWDATTGKLLREITGHAGIVFAAAFSADGKHALTASSDKTARLWEVATGKEVMAFKGHTSSVKSVEFSPNGKTVLTASFDNTARLWETATGKEVAAFKAHTRAVVAAFSPDGTRVVTASQDQTGRVWDIATGKPVCLFRQFGSDTTGFRAVAFSPDGTQVTTGSSGGTRVWDAATGKNITTLNVNGEGFASTVYAATFSPDGKHILTGTEGGTARLFDVAARRFRSFRGHTAPVLSVAFNADGSRVLTGGADKVTRLWDATTGKELCQLVGFRNGDWAVTDPAGRFDASNAGDVDGLHWVVGNEPIALKQLKERYYEPGLLAKVYGEAKEKVRQVEAFTAPKLFPQVAVQSPPKGTATANVTLTNQGGGIGKVVVKVNGKEFVADARPAKSDADAKSATLAVDLSAVPNLVPGQANKVEVIAYNAEGYLSGRGATFDYDAPAAAQPDAPRLHAIVVGTSNYAGEKLNLKYAAKDAEDFATALALGGGRLFGADKAHVMLLTTSGKPGIDAPTKANIKKAFEAVRKAAKPADVLLVYLAGHGTTLARGSDLYLYPTRDATSLAAEAFADPAVLAATAVTSEELTEWVKAIPANKQVMILDTCAAGAAATKLTEKRDVSGDQVRALDRLKDRTGFHVLMGCSADAVSYETTRFAQGLLTYSLLEGMKGAALRDGEFVEVDKLFAYATDRVPALAGDVGGVQRPLVSAPRGAAFPFARLTAEDKPKVPLAAARPLVLASNFQDEVRLKDALGLKKLVDVRLRDLAGTARGSKVVFVDAAEFPGALEIAGRYKVDGDAISVRVTVFQGEKEIAAFGVTGEKDKPDALAEKLVAEVEKRLPAGK